jgi:Flp pilus assembly secretin CpaC
MAATIRTHGFIFAVTLLLIPSSLAWAADQTIILRLGAGSTLLLERPFKTVLIGDPNVVDVLTQSDRSVILLPRNLGSTNIIFLDERSIAITNVRILVYGTSVGRINCQDVAEISDRQTSLLDKVLNGSNARKQYTRPLASLRAHRHWLNPSPGRS